MGTTLIFGDFVWVAIIAAVFGGGVAYFFRPAKTTPSLEALPEYIIKALSVEPDTAFSLEIHNDNITPMEHVVEVLSEYFGFSKNDATDIMLQVHKSDTASLPLKIEEKTAQQLVEYIHKASRKRGFPLQCSVIKA